MQKITPFLWFDGQAEAAAKFDVSIVRKKQPLTDALALLTTSYRHVISIAGADLTARLAPDRPLRHAMFLGWVGVGLGVIGVVATWSAGLGPRWSPVSLVGLALPQCWTAGKIFERLWRVQPAGHNP